MFGKQLFQKHGQSPQKVVNGRFELEREGKTAYLEYNLAANVLQLLHTEVPPELRGLGLHPNWLNQLSTGRREQRQSGRDLPQRCCLYGKASGV